MQDARVVAVPYPIRTLITALIFFWFRTKIDLSKIVVDTDVKLAIGAFFIGTILVSDLPWIKFFSSTGNIFWHRRLTRRRYAKENTCCL